LELEQQIIQYILSLKDINAIIISDYAKGVISSTLCEFIIEYSNKSGIYTFIDPKTKNYNKYRNCFCFKPNLLEGEIISESKNKYDILNIIKNKINCKNIILTCSEDGMYVNSIHNHIKIKNKIIPLDVTGCGDIVLTILVYEYLKCNDILRASKIANDVACKSIQNIGNYIIKSEDLENYIDDIIYDYETDKINKLKEKYLNSNIVFTNGCFDVIHSEHIGLLNFTKKQGDILIIGLNSDESIKRIKGNERPINSIDERCKLLKNTNMVDYIIVFNNDTPLEILKLLCPNTIVKGGDYKKENIIGKEYAKNIIIYDYNNNISSSKIINNIKKNAT
jgi:D-beta-D-heptose 7-phosphate kinase/D-beta-D-heptose 1-phosphate adenosyltransferase